MNIVFVCTGNTCRSPMAKGIFEKIAKERGGSHLKCDSAGVLVNKQSGATENAVKVCREIGVDIAKHASKSISSIDKKNVDLFVAMTKQHGEMIKNLGIDNEKIYVPDPEIEDPYGGDIYVYRKCRDEIEKAAEVLIDSLLLSGDLN